MYTNTLLCTYDIPVRNVPSKTGVEVHCVNTLQTERMNSSKHDKREII